MKFLFFALLLTSVLVTTPSYAITDASGALDLERPIAKIGEVLSRNLEAATCIGTPVVIGEMTLVPLVSKGFGFGLGGGSNQRGEVANHDKDAKELNNDHNGMGCGAGGFLKIVAVMVVRKDGTFNIHRMEENFLVQLANQYAPLAKEMIQKVFEFRMMRLQNGSDGQPPAPLPMK